MEYILTPGAKIESELVYVPIEKYLYTKNKVNSNGSITYICHDNKSFWRCSARITILDEYHCKYTEKSKTHTGHPNHEETYRKNYVHDQFKRRSLEILNVCGWQSEKISLQPILHQIQESLPDEFMNVKVDTKYLLDYLNKLKRKQYPKSPQSSDELMEAMSDPEMQIFARHHAVTVKGDDHESYAFTILCDKNILKEISNTGNREIFMDATFDIVPKGPYQQLLVIYLGFDGNIYPIIYIFMESKCVPSYEQVFNYIENHLIKLSPQSIHSDYEASLVRALRNVYPESKITGCWFHYCQALRKRFRYGKQNEMFRDLINNSDAYNLYKKLLSLPLLPAARIPEGFDIIKKEIFKKGFSKFFKSNLEYFDKYWLKKCEQISVFKVEHRTTSSLESYNAILNSLTPKGGHFFKVIDRLYEQIDIQSKRLSAVFRGISEPSCKRPKKQQNKNDNLTLYMKKLENGTCDTAQYLNKVIRTDCFDSTILDTLFMNESTQQNRESKNEIEEDYYQVEDFLCYLCATKRCNIVFRPCHHNIVCSSCFSKQISVCPKCKKTITDIIEIKY